MRAQERDRVAMERRQRSGKGESDILGITRGRCLRGGCNCNAYIQKHGRTTVLLQHRGMVQNDNDTRFFACVCCGHDVIDHADLRYGPDGKKRGQKFPSPPRAVESQHYYTPSGLGTRGGLNSRYYSATGSVAQSETATPMQIDPQTVGAAGKLAGGAVERDIAAKGGQSYYYAQNHKVDYKIPVVPHKLDPKDAKAGWGVDRDDPSLTAASDPLAAVKFSIDGECGAVENVETSELCDSCDPLSLASSLKPANITVEPAAVPVEKVNASAMAHTTQVVADDKDTFEAADLADDGDKDFFDD